MKELHSSDKIDDIFFLEFAPLKELTPLAGGFKSSSEHSFEGLPASKPVIIEASPAFAADKSRRDLAAEAGAGDRTDNSVSQVLDQLYALLAAVVAEEKKAGQAACFVS